MPLVSCQVMAVSVFASSIPSSVITNLIFSTDIWVCKKLKTIQMKVPVLLGGIAGAVTYTFCRNMLEEIYSGVMERLPAAFTTIIERFETRPLL